MEELCRICLTSVTDSSKCISIYLELVDNKSVIEVLNECSSIEVFEEDDLPKFICVKCMEKLSFIYEFRSLIIKSDIYLKTGVEIKRGRGTLCHDEEINSLLGECNELNNNDKMKEEKPKDLLQFQVDLEDADFNKPNADTGKKAGRRKVVRKRRKIYGCQECKETFKSLYSYKNHNSNHTGVKPFSCEFCGKGFSMKWALTIHIRTHTGDKPFSCDVCQKNFGSPSSLTIHKRIHNGVKKFNCDVCDKGFYQSSQLTVHMRSHTGEKPYMCEVCSNTFGDRSNMLRHMGRHRQGQKIPCPVCGKTYKGEICLQAHIKRHAGLKPFACNECGRKFSLRNSLNRHVMIHSGVKPYKCEVCQKRFSQGGILVRHMRIHSGEKPYPCPTCPKEFAYKHHLQGHVRSHHKDVDVEGTPNATDNFSEGKFEVKDYVSARTDLAGCYFDQRITTCMV